MNIMDFFNVLPIAEQFHCYRVAAISKLMAEVMGLSSPEVDTIAHSALLHDVGKAMVPRALHRVPRELSEDDRPIVLSHTTVGSQMLSNTGAILSTASIVALQHHEYLNGCGYLGLTDKAIHPHAKLVTVADIFDKLAFCQPGEEMRKVEKTSAVLLQCAETKLDGQMVLTLLSNMDQVLVVGHRANINAFSFTNTHC